MQALFFCLIGYTVDGFVYRRTRQHLIQRDKDQGGIYAQNHLRAIVLRKSCLLTDIVELHLRVESKVI